MALRIVSNWQGPRQHTVKRATGPSQTIGSHHPKAAPPAIQIQMALRIVLHWQGPWQHTVKRATGPSQTIGSHHPNHDTLSHTIILNKMLTQHIIYKTQHTASLSDVRMTFSRRGFLYFLDNLYNQSAMVFTHHLQLNRV